MLRGIIGWFTGFDDLYDVYYVNVLECLDGIVVVSEDDFSRWVRKLWEDGKTPLEASRIIKRVCSIYVV